MLARVATMGGPRVYRIRGPRDVDRAAWLLAERDADLISRGLAPPWNRARVRYRREGPRTVEDWSDAREVARRGFGDCEDLAAYRAADLAVGGVDARPVSYVTRSGRVIHVVVAIPDGRLLDPSRERGMGGSRMRYSVGYDPEVGAWQAAVAIPGYEPIWDAYGTDPGDALAEAILAADDDADEDLAVAGIGESIGSLAGSLLPGGSAIGGALGGLAERGVSALTSLFTRRRVRRRPQLGTRESPALVVGPDGRVAVPTQTDAPSAGPLQAATARGSGQSIRPMPDALRRPPARERARLATAAAIAQGVRDARDGDAEAWRAIATLARVLRAEDPGGPWHRLISALSAGGRR